MDVTQIRNRVRRAQRHYDQNTQSIDDVLLAERGYVTRPPIGEEVVMLCSGGLDSSILVQWAIDAYDVRAHLLFIRRGARAEAHEENAFDFFTAFYRERFPGKIVTAMKISCTIPPHEIKQHLPKELADTIGHPLRNATLQNIAVMYAVSRGDHVTTVFTGSVGEDNTEPELGLLSLRSQTLNTCIQLADWRWQITSPFTDTALCDEPVYKVDLIRYAHDNNIPIEKTRTCFGTDEQADGTCFACRKRADAFRYAGLLDSQVK